MANLAAAPTKRVTVQSGQFGSFDTFGRGRAGHSLLCQRSGYLISCLSSSHQYYYNYFLDCLKNQAPFYFASIIIILNLDQLRPHLKF